MTNQINDGGPAFPSKDVFGHIEGGMTIRDYFAASCAQALLGVLKPDDEKILAKDGIGVAQDRVARGAYTLADAMIRVRQET